MKVRWVTLALLLVALSAGGAGGYFGSGYLRERAAAEPLARAREQLRPFVVDPESLQFERVRENGGAICGYVNTRNRMGGYVGFRPFVIAPGQRVEIDNSDGSASTLDQQMFEQQWSEHCA